MLTREHAISKIVGRTIVPDRLTQAKHADYGRLASLMLNAYENGVGETRKTLHTRIQRIFELVPSCPPKRIAAFCKLLDERAQYLNDKRGTAANLRRQVFRMASEFQPLSTSELLSLGTKASEARRMIAERLNRSWPDIEHTLFLDLPENHTLKSFEGYNEPTLLLSRYNVAQAQAILYDAQQLTVLARTDLKSVLRYAKLARLMHRIQRNGDSYRIDFDGPASLLHRTTRYGVAMAKYLPGLLSCRDWSAKAWVHKRKWGRLIWQIDSQSGLKSEVVVSEEFDSQLEERFYTEWQAAETSHWSLHRECEMLHQGQTVFFPDFQARHIDGRSVLIEIIGFWTPEYLDHKLRVLKQFADQRILLVVQSNSAKALVPTLHHPIVEYKTKIKLEPILTYLNGLDRP